MSSFNIYNVWFFILQLPLRLLWNIKSPDYWSDKLKSIDPKEADHVFRLLDEPLVESSSFGDLDMIGNTAIPQGANVISNYRMGFLIALVVYIVFLYRVDCYNRRKVTPFIEGHNTALTINGKCYGPQLDSEKKKGAAVRNIASESPELVCDDVAYTYFEAEPDDNWCGNSWVTLQSNVTELYCPSLRLQKTPNVGLLTEDFNTTRSAAISLLLWDLK